MLCFLLMWNDSIAFRREGEVQQDILPMNFSNYVLYILNSLMHLALNLFLTSALVIFSLYTYSILNLNILLIALW